MLFSGTNFSLIDADVDADVDAVVVDRVAKVDAVVDAISTVITLSFILMNKSKVEQRTFGHKTTS